MSLPNYLAKIKSSGVYRFVWDKSIITPAQAATLRMVVGYSEVGPFNTPVYVTNVSEFYEIFGRGSRRLERRGSFFHRMAVQALAAGPILALNLKPFTDETTQFLSFNAGDALVGPNYTATAFPDTENEYVRDIRIADLYDTNRFWTVNIDNLANTVDATNNVNGYINIAQTDLADSSCTVFVRKTKPVSYKGITFRSWYTSQNIEYPEYMEALLDKNMDDYFMEVYVFKGDFTNELMGGALKNYFEKDGSGAYKVKASLTDSFGETVDNVVELMSTNSNSNFVGVYSGITIPNFKDANGYYISLDLKFNTGSVSHKMLMKLDEALLEDKFDDADALNAMLVKSTEDIYPVYIRGYKYDIKNHLKSDECIYDACTKVLKMPGMRTALTNRVDVDYHYLIDTFDVPITNYVNDIEIIGSPVKTYKSIFTSIVKEKDNAFAILNFPKMSELSKHAYFKKANSTDFDITKVPDCFYLPTEEEGASYCAFYTQLVFSDGSIKTTVPSAALVSNLFMNKWSTRHPYDIVAGPKFGRINAAGLVGPDYNFGRSDLDVLEPMGVNAIVYVPRQGTYINSNQTAKQTPVSGLSKVHIRELVIHLQNEIEHLLQSYQWELNTQALRDTIKYNADVICDTIMNNGGLYAYKNTCDETNNTPEVIDNEMIILDTEIEPARGAGKMVHQLTIHKTGALTSTVS
jgi:hypothetical protein